ncbi:MULTISPECIES: DUF4189 domain-containing protein [Hydrogenophaga]|uniref:DUF4189 domain-containing protein n=1 Tax=Hydrogenophaga electricum TaxID=1230953 RepID=A0ABQ6CB95_9BURK|nr:MULTISPECIES: DUF4189 domain-containing protein [Hydrogenophaga]GLS16913.1 hypothetical protein GCM10007935_43590 [Hydrogenophaga electricum]
MLFRHCAPIALAIASAALLSACGGGDGIFENRGAIAVSETTGAVAISWDAANQNLANDKARSLCGQSDCKVVLQFSKCGAFSVDTNARIYAVAEGNSATEAQEAADNSCRANGGQTCTAIPELPAKCN